MYMYLYIGILGRMRFVERSIRLVEEQCIILHRSSGFRSFHRLLRQYCFVRLFACLGQLWGWKQRLPR